MPVFFFAFSTRRDGMRPRTVRVRPPPSNPCSATIANASSSRRPVAVGFGRLDAVETWNLTA
jgi:hypothetical protein